MLIEQKNKMATERSRGFDLKTILRLKYGSRINYILQTLAPLRQSKTSSILPGLDFIYFITTVGSLAILSCISNLMCQGSDTYCWKGQRWSREQDA